MLISTLVDAAWPTSCVIIWQYMLISTLVDEALNRKDEAVWQYMLISTLVDLESQLRNCMSDSIC